MHNFQFNERKSTYENNRKLEKKKTKIVQKFNFACIDDRKEYKKNNNQTQRTNKIWNQFQKSWLFFRYKLEIKWSYEEKELLAAFVPTKTGAAYHRESVKLFERRRAGCRSPYCAHCLHVAIVSVHQKWQSKWHDWCHCETANRSEGIKLWRAKKSIADERKIKSSSKCQLI